MIDLTMEEQLSQSKEEVDRKRHAEIFWLVYELSRLMTLYFDKAMAPRGMTHSLWWALMHVSQNQGATQSELARLMQIGRAPVGKLLERLEALGLVVRREDENDARVKRAYLADQNADSIAVMAEDGIRLFRAYLSSIDDDKQINALAGMRVLKDLADIALGTRSAPEGDDAEVPPSATSCGLVTRRVR
jgi:MarR family transcriptional regulator for hemolysin